VFGANFDFMAAVREQTWSQVLLLSQSSLEMITADGGFIWLVENAVKFRGWRQARVLFAPAHER
jgi:hypothetical protein